MMKIKPLMVLVSVFSCIVLLSCKNTNEIPAKSALKMSYEEANERAHQLVGQMSFEEKVAMLHGLGGGNSEFGDLDVRFFSIAGIQRLNIPPLYMGHGITGVRSRRDTSIHATYFYSPVSMGCSWDKDLYSKVS